MEQIIACKECGYENLASPSAKSMNCGRCETTIPLSRRGGESRGTIRERLDARDKKEEKSRPLFVKLLIASFLILKISFILFKVIGVGNAGGPRNQPQNQFPGQPGFQPLPLMDNQAQLQANNRVIPPVGKMAVEITEVNDQKRDHPAVLCLRVSFEKLKDFQPDRAYYLLLNTNGSVNEVKLPDVTWNQDEGSFRINLPVANLPKSAKLISIWLESTPRGEPLVRATVSNTMIVPLPAR
jgi:hypothetical protein